MSDGDGVVRLGVHISLVAPLCVADRRPVPSHLPLAWTHSSAGDVQAFIAQLDALAAVVRSKPVPETEAHQEPAAPQTV